MQLVQFLRSLVHISVEIVTTKFKIQLHAHLLTYPFLLLSLADHLQYLCSLGLSLFWRWFKCLFKPGFLHLMFNISKFVPTSQVLW